MSATEKALVDRADESTFVTIDERVRAGLAILWRAFLCSQDTGAKLWDVALPIGRLYEAGISSADLRWMLAKNFVEHREETTGDADAHRSFRRGNDFFLNNRSCFILTRTGAALAEHLFPEPDGSAHDKLPMFESIALRVRPPQPGKETTPVVKPGWDPIRRELTIAGLIVKRFRVPARNQETILNAFEEEGWVEHIHDPLPSTIDIDAPTRLHDAINRLNRCQINPVIRFHGDGKGTGVFWGLTNVT